MTETEIQSLVELIKQFEEVKLSSAKLAEDRARHFEEQKLHSQYMKKQLMEMKELLLNMAKGQQEAASAPRSPTSPLNEKSESVDDYLGRFECAHHVLDEMPKLFADEIDLEIAHQVLDEMSEPKEFHNHDQSTEEVLEIDGDLSQDLVEIKATYGIRDAPAEASDLNHDLAAHQVFDETPKSANTIEIDDTESMEQEESNRDEPMIVDELPHQAALQVLDKMPRSFVSGELIFLDEVEKINEELVDGLNWKAPPMSSVKELKGYMRLICFDPGGLQQGYGPPPLPKPPAGFVVDDQGRVLMASSKRIVTVVDPTNNLPLECTIRRIFTSSKGAECMLLCPVDMPVEIVKSTSNGWAAVTDEELEAILPTADYALARKHMHLVHRDHAMCLSNKNLESAAGEDNISVEGMFSELRKSYFAAEPVLKIPSMISEKEHKNLKLFEVNDLKHITPLLLVINDFSDFVKCPTEPLAQEVRMVDYIVACFNVWVFDPGGHLLIHATFGLAENLLNASAENLIEHFSPFGSGLREEEMLSAFDDFDRCCTGIKLSNGAAELLAYDYDSVKVEVIGLNYKMSFGRTHLIQWLETESYKVLHGSSVALPLCLHRSVYDPWGQGSSQGGSIVTGKWV